MENMPVDVISMCSAAGEIRPLRLRMEDEAHQLLRVDIEEVAAAKRSSMWVSRPRCSCAVPPSGTGSGFSS